MFIKNLYKKYEYIWLSLVVIITWGLVPLFAKIGNLPGGQTTMWVNIFGTIGVLLIMIFFGKLSTIKKGLPYISFIKLAVVWPLIYSIAYFSAIKMGGPSIATITNYTWPAFALVWAHLLLKRNYPAKVWFVIVLAMLGVAIPLLLEGNVRFLLWPVVFGIIAGLTQGYSNVKTDDTPESTTWVLTLIVQLVTAIGAGIFALLFEKFQMPSVTTFGYLAYLGVIAGSIGFWAFIRASSIKKTDSQATTFYVLMCLTPLAQVFALLIPWWHVETVSPLRWIGVILVSSCFLVYRILTRKNHV